MRYVSLRKKAEVAVCHILIVAGLHRIGDALGGSAEKAVQRIKEGTKTSHLLFVQVLELEHDRIHLRQKRLYCVEELLEALDQRREYERQHEFYLCEVCSIRFEFGEAMDFGFECPECGSPLESMENSRLVDSMERRIEELREELNVEEIEEARA